MYVLHDFHHDFHRLVDALPISYGLSFPTSFDSSRHFADLKLFMPQGIYTEAHTFAHLSGYHVVKVKEPAPRGA